MAAGPEDNEETHGALRPDRRAGAEARRLLRRPRPCRALPRPSRRGHRHLCRARRPPRSPIAPPPACARAARASARRSTLRAAGVTVALGTDNVAANNSYDMVAEMRVAGLVASHREGVARSRFRARELVRMATIEGARALGLDHEIGSLEAGQGGRHHRHRHGRGRLFGNARLRDAAGLFRQRARRAPCLGRGRAAGARPAADPPPLSPTSAATIRATYADFWARVAQAPRNREVPDVTRRTFILDTDGGVDDAQALLMLIANGRAPDVITTVFGNVGLDQATRTCWPSCAVAGADDPGARRRRPAAGAADHRCQIYPWRRRPGRRAAAGDAAPSRPATMPSACWSKPSAPPPPRAKRSIS